MLKVDKNGDRTLRGQSAIALNSKAVKNTITGEYQFNFIEFAEIDISANDEAEVDLLRTTI
eukprot:Awhi_evm1s10067